MCTDDVYSGVDNLGLMAEAVNYNQYLINLIKAYAGSTKTLVDFGAGTGTFARSMSEQGYQVVCIEPDASMRSSLMAQQFTTYSDITQLSGATLDFIYTLNVLEHIEDDSEAMDQLFAALRPGGRLLVYVPAFGILYTSMDRKVGHYRRYRRRSLVRALHAAGFEIDQARYVDSLGFFAALLYRWLGNERGDLNRSALCFYDRAAFPVSRALDKIFSRLFGKNLLVYARRVERTRRSAGGL
jgi:SAM-dependent methyltransferase